MMADIVPSDWTAVAASVANIGFSAVVAWYLLVKALPSVQERFEATMSDQRKEFTDSIAAQRGDFIAAIKEQRTDFLGTLDRERKLIDMMMPNSKGH